MFAIRKRLAVGISITSAMALMVSAVAAGDYRQVNFPVENCINLGSGLESPEEGQWGYNIKQEHFGIIRAKGFDTVRIPVKWTKWVPEGVWQPTYNPSPLSHFNRSLSQAPYTINPAFLSRVDEVISWAMQAGLKVVVNVHHFDELEIEPANPATYNNQEKRLIAIWKQLGEHYRNMPSGLMFEIINEPKGQFQGEYLNRTQLAALAEIRKTNPTRTVILTGDQTGGVPGIDNLRLPPNDLNVVASVHSYTPGEFTHQCFLEGGDPSCVRREYPQPGELSYMTSEIDGLVAWRNRNGVPVFMGEYGSIKFASTASRGRYARDSTNNLKRTQIPGCTWAFGDGAFQIYDSTTNKWDENIIAGIQLGTKDIVLYDDAMGSWLRNTSWNSVTSNPNTQFKKSGANSLEVNLPASVGWSGYEFSWQRSTIPAAPPLSPYSALRFWIYGTPSTGVLQVSIHQEGNDANGNPIIIPPTRTVNITPTSGAWREVVIPMTDLGSPTNNYFRLTFKGMTESATPHKFYLDDVRLSQTGSATPPGKLLIYDDIYENTSPAGLATWLYDSSWTGVITKPSTQVVKSGASSLEVEFPASVGWAGYELGLQRKHLDVSLMPYSALRFWIYGTSSTGALQVAIDQAIWVNGYIPGGSFNRFITPAFTPTLGWSEVKIPLSSFKPLPDNRTNGNLTQLFRLSFKGATESTVAPKFYLDQVQFE